MTTAAGPQKTISIYDYPEHLNPFREDDNHNKIRFWTIGRRLSRSNSINFSGIKDLKNSWALRSFMKKGKKREQTPTQEQNDKGNGESSPIVYRRALQYSSNSIGARSTVGSPERAERYVYGGSVTPLPRSRFQERLRSSSQNEVSSVTPRMARSEMSGSRLSVESTNPFDECPVPPVRASRRKKKRAPPPPPGGLADTSIGNQNSELQVTEIQKKKTNNIEGEDVEEMNLNIELKIVEDEDCKERIPNDNVQEKSKTDNVNGIVESVQTVISTRESIDEKATNNTIEEVNGNEMIAESDNDVTNSELFPKIDIAKYRRNSSVNEDDIRLRRGNLEDFHNLSNKRSQSLMNTNDTTYITYDINLNESRLKDTNCNEEPKKVICKVYEDSSRKHSIDTISSTEKEFNEIDKVRREFENEINKLNEALEKDFATGAELTVSEIKRKYDRSEVSSPNPIPKPRRSHYGDPGSPVSGKVL